jgi:hypothetical protein
MRVEISGKSLSNGLCPSANPATSANTTEGTILVSNADDMKQTIVRYSNSALVYLVDHSSGRTPDSLQISRAGELRLQPVRRGVTTN